MSLFVGGIGLIVLAALASLLLATRPRLADGALRLLMCGGSVLVLIPAVAVLTGHSPLVMSFRPPIPGGPWVAGIDQLTSWFLLIICLGGAATTWYGVGYLAPERRHRAIAPAHAGVAILVVAMMAVVTARSVVLFLVAWEIMAVGAYFLIMFENEQEETRRAGLLYLVLTHTGTLALFVMFLVWSGGGADLTFASLLASPALRYQGGVVLLLALVGFGVKAGIVPLHFWLPGAHAAAPSHVSALLSGVMLKIGIYGLLRVILLVGTPPAWWGWLVFGLGLASGILGVLWALAQHDVKRLLAYHSVENIGIILLGIGVGVLGLAYGHPVVALLGFTGALLHALNHALFKSLLFLGAGAVVRATGTRLIDRLGGLGRRMPLTALAFGLGSVAIVGLPPLNGFVSEWVVFLAIFRSAGFNDAIRLAIVGAPALALIGGLALACFSKLDAVLFLGHPRSPVPPVKDPGWGTLTPIGFLVMACLLIGLVPAIVVGPAMRVARSVAGAIEEPGLLTTMVRMSWQVSAVALGLLLVTALLVLSRSWKLHRVPASMSDTWACAKGPGTGRTQYTASSYAATLLGAVRRISGLHVTRTATSYSEHPTDPVLNGFVMPIWLRFGQFGQRVRAVQGGRIRWYLLSVIITLLILLIHIAIRREMP